jgi:hypothetical protein
VGSPQERNNHQQQEARAPQQPNPQSLYPIAHPSTTSIFSSAPHCQIEIRLHNFLFQNETRENALE